MPDWFVTSKMTSRFFAALGADENIIYFNENSGNAIFSCNKMGILNIDLNNVNLDNNFDEGDLILLFLSDLWLRILNLKNPNHYKKISEELTPA